MRELRELFFVVGFITTLFATLAYGLGNRVQWRVDITKDSIHIQHNKSYYNDHE